MPLDRRQELIRAAVENDFLIVEDDYECETNYMDQPLPALRSMDSEGRVFLHRGIAGRQFQRSFVLADGVEVGEALMENGLLHVDLTQAKPETVVQTINIRKG